MAAVGIASPSLSPNSPSAVSPKSTPQEAGSPIHEAEVEVISTTPASSVKSRACDACRRRKSKCVYAKERLECDACVSYRLECTFAADLQPRKRKSSVESDEVRPSKQRPQAFSDSNLSLRTSSPSREENSQMDEIRGIINSGDWKYAACVGPTVETEPELIELSARDSLLSGGKLYFKRSNTVFALDWAAAQRSEAARPALLANLDALVGTIGPQLIGIYQQHVSAHLPVVEPDFLIAYQQGRLQEVDPLLLAAVFAVALPWLLQDENNSALMNLSTKIVDSAVSMFSDSQRCPTLSTVQAGMLLVQRPKADHLKLNSQLVNAAYAIGLHLDCTNWNVTNSDKALRKRLAWSLYMQDKWCSLVHGRPSLISEGNWAVAGLSEEDFSLYTAPASDEDDASLLFRELVELTKICATILDTFYTVEAQNKIERNGPSGTRLILELAKPVQIDLKKWFAELPTALKMDSLDSPYSSDIGFLHLAYFATEITLHRCIIRSLRASSSDAYLAHICRSAAKTRLISAMDFVNRLRPEHLNSFWYFPSEVSFALIGSFGSLLLATAPSQEEADFYRTRLGEFRWTLGVSSRRASFLTFAVENLDRFDAILKDLPEKPRTAGTTPQNWTHGPAEASTYFVDEEMKLEEDEDDTLHGELFASQADRAEHAISTRSGLISPSTSTETASSYDAFA